MSSDYIGISFSGLGERDHKLSKAFAADLVIIKPEFEAGLIECATQCHYATFLGKFSIEQAWKCFIAH